jgi:predicted lipoprotein with Yx(FWY)xxD motif
VPASAAGGTTLLAKTISGKSVLANAQGFTLYWFVPDTATTSKCTGSCATYWPPVKGPAAAGSGVTGKLGIITRSDGTTQATYNGHPLYTYAGDTAPGQDKGNGLNVSGGLWHIVPVTGSAAPAATSSAMANGGCYGY